MPDLNSTLSLDRCPHCCIARPHLKQVHKLENIDSSRTFNRKWIIYECSHCANLVTAWSLEWNGPVLEHYPSLRTIDKDVPEKPREFLRQSNESMHAPAGAIMLAASAVDAMLKLKGDNDGSLYSRIEKAAADHLITNEMSDWAHEVRLDANDQRHADDNAGLPCERDAKRALDFALALAQFLFVLPGKIQRGLRQGEEPG